MVKALLASRREPYSDEAALDNPETTANRRTLIRNKPTLQMIYHTWYDLLLKNVPNQSRPVLEIGSGAGFLAEYSPRVITSEILSIPGVHLVCDGLVLPIATHSLDGVVMINVLHHLPDPGRFFRETARTVEPGGVLAMIEPWNTPWARLVYRGLHHEPFEPKAPTWQGEAGHPLSGANGALPWIIFQRDRLLFEKQHPEWRVEKVVPFMPFSYLLSGGLSYKPFLPDSWFHALLAVETRLAGVSRAFGMFAYILLKRQ